MTPPITISCRLGDLINESQPPFAPARGRCDDRTGVRLVHSLRPLKRLASGRPLDGVVTRDALDAADLPLIAPIDRMRLPVGEPGWESMQACMGISSLTTISSRQTPGVQTEKAAE